MPVGTILREVMAVDSTTIASGMVVGFAALCVASRFYIRKRDKTGIGWDDWWILIGFSMTFLTGGLLLWGNVSRAVQFLWLTMSRRHR